MTQEKKKSPKTIVSNTGVFCIFSILLWINQNFKNEGNAFTIIEDYEDGTDPKGRQVQMTRFGKYIHFSSFKMYFTTTS